MPISREDFQKYFGNGEDVILKFLEKNQDKAYTAAEIILAVGPKSPGNDTWEQILLGSELAVSYVNMLNALVDKKWVQRHYINGGCWYAYRHKPVDAAFEKN
jgi:hypothetical protein